jgi:hypothetical protein
MRLLLSNLILSASLWLLLIQLLQLLDPAKGDPVNDTCLRLGQLYIAIESLLVAGY